MQLRKEVLAATERLRLAEYTDQQKPSTDQKQGANQKQSNAKQSNVMHKAQAEVKALLELEFVESAECRKLYTRRFKNRPRRGGGAFKNQHLLPKVPKMPISHKQ